MCSRAMQAISAATLGPTSAAVGGGGVLHEDVNVLVMHAGL